MIRQLAVPRIWKYISSTAIRDGIIVFVATLLVNMSNYGFHFIASHRMSVEDYGAFSAMLSFMTLVSVPATIVMTVIAKSVAELHAGGHLECIPALQYAILRPVLVVAGLVLCLSFLARDPLSEYLQLPTNQAVPLAGLVIALALVMPVMRGSLQGLQNFMALASSLIIEGAGKLLAGTVLMLIGYGFMGGMLGIAIGTALALCVSLFSTGIFNRHRSRPKREYSPIKVDWKRFGATSIAVSATTLCLGSLGSLDLILVRHFFSPHDAGIYSAAALIGKIFLFASAFIPMLLLPKATAHAVQQSSTNSPLARALVLGSAVSIVGLLIVAMWPEQAIRYLPGSAYLQATPLLLRYSIATVFLALTTIATTVKIGLHQFLFLLPLALCTLGELLAIQYRHATLVEIINILLVGHGLALLGCFSRWVPRTQFVQSAR